MSRSSPAATGVYFRYLDEFGDPVVVAAAPRTDRQVGFRDDEALFPNDNRIFRGFDLAARIFHVSAQVSGLSS